MLIDTVVKGFPKHKIDEFKSNIDDLIRRGILLRKPSKYGTAVCINNDLRVKVREELKKHYDFI